jgi:thiosulfate/3-mercaptopyruvate sulfurtransferase
MTEYAYPDLLVSTAWVAEHLHDPHVRIVESDEDILLYDVGHIPGAIKVDWQSELQHQVVRDYIDKDAFSRLLGSKGIRPDHTVVLEIATTGGPATPSGYSSCMATGTVAL